jgi:hypothetical protein
MSAPRFHALDDPEFGRAMGGAPLPRRRSHDGVAWENAMLIDESFHTAYRELEERMKARAEADGDVFLSNPEPLGTVQYVLIPIRVDRFESS